MMILLKLGRYILEVEVTNISTHGLWILVEDKEYFLPFEQFPWFEDKTINDITKVESFGEGHLYWKNLDIDLSVEMIDHPERFPPEFLDKKNKKTKHLKQGIQWT